jgi:hypothetical protein
VVSLYNRFTVIWLGRKITKQQAYRGSDLRREGDIARRNKGVLQQRGRSHHDPTAKSGIVREVLLHETLRILDILSDSGQPEPWQVVHGAKHRPPRDRGSGLRKFKLKHHPSRSREARASICSSAICRADTKRWRDYCGFTQDTE